MAPRQLNIKIKVDDATLRRVARQQLTDLQRAEKAAEKMAAAAQKAADKAANAKIKADQKAAEAAQKLADRTALAAQKAADRAANARIKADERAALASQKAADKAANAVQKAADKAALAAQKAADKAANAKVKGDQRAADAAQKAADKASNAAQKAADRAANAKIKADERAVLSAQKLADRTALAAQKAADRASSSKIKADQKAADAQVRAAQRAADRLDRIQNQLLVKDYKRQVRREEASARAAKKQAEEGSAIERAMQSAGSAVLGMVGAYAGLGAVTALMDGLRQSADAAAEAQHRMTEDLIRQRDAARELRSMEGKSSTTQSTVDDAKFSQNVGMSVEEAREFRLGFMGSGAQYHGKTMSASESDQYQEMIAKLSATKGIDLSVMGNFAGTIMGSSDYNKHGDQAAEVAVGDFNQALSVLQHGKGSNRTIVAQLEKLASFSLDDDEVRGAFNSKKDVSAALSVAAEVDPEQSEVYVRSGMKAIRGFDDKQGDLLARAGVTAKTGYFESFEKLAPVLEAEAKAKGEKLADTVRRYFGDEREQKAVLAGINKGVRGGLFRERLDFADTVKGPGPALAEIDKNENNPDATAQQRKAEAFNRRSKLELGAKSARAAALYERAEGQLRDRGELEGTGNTWGDWFSDNVLDMPARLGGFSAPGARDRKIRDEAVDTLERRAMAKGVPFDKRAFYRDTPEGDAEFSQALDREIGRVDAAPARAPQPAAANGQAPTGGAIVKELKAINANTKPKGMARPLPQARPPGPAKRI